MRRLGDLEIRRSDNVVIRHGDKEAMHQALNTLHLAPHSVIYVRKTLERGQR